MREEIREKLGERIENQEDLNNLIDFIFDAKRWDAKTLEIAWK